MHGHITVQGGREGVITPCMAVVSRLYADPRILAPSLPYMLHTVIVYDTGVGHGYSYQISVSGDFSPR